MSSPLDRDRQLTLMARTVPGNPARNNAPPLGQEIPEQPGILEIDRCLIYAKSARPSSLEQTASASPTFAVISFHHFPLVQSN